MGVFESFNFDIIIVLILVSSLIFGLYFTLYRQLRRTIVLILPFVILSFSFNLIYRLITGVGFIKDYGFKALEFIGFDTYVEYAFSLIVYFFSYLVIAIIIRVVYSFFRISVKNRVLGKKSGYSKVASALLGLLNGYILGMLLMFILSPFIGLNYNKPLTKVYLATTNDALTFSRLNQVSNTNTELYLEYEDTLGALTGRDVLNAYDKINLKFTYFEELEAEFNNELLEKLSPVSVNLLAENKLLYSFVKGANVIFGNEKQTDHLKRLRQINKAIRNDLVYLNIYYNLVNKDEDAVINYVVDNYDDLILEASRNLERDTLIKEYNIFTRYIENKDEYLSLLEYESVDIVSDVIYYETYLNKNLDSFIIDFNLRYANEETEEIKKLKKVFASYTANKDLFIDSQYDFSLSTKLTLVSNYRYYYKKEVVFKNQLINVYLKETLLDLNANGHELYSEYFFYKKLNVNSDADEITMNDFLIILDNLDKVVDGGMFNLAEANVYLYNLFASKKQILLQKLNDNVIDEIKLLDNKFISAELIELIS